MTARRRMSPGAVVLAAAIPILFLHVAYQPGVSFGFGSTTVNAYLSDFAVLAVVVTALVEGMRRGFGPLAHGRWLWLAGGLFVVWLAVGVVHGHLHSSSYAWHAHGVTASKFAEYMLLAPAVPLLLRSRGDLLLPVWSLALWSAAATVAGVAQFFGADIFLAGTVGRRQASFLSSADFAALSAAAVLVGLVALAVGAKRLRTPAWVAGISGGVGMVVAGAVASLLGLATAVAVLALALLRRRELQLRRATVVAAAAGLVAVGILAIRGSDLDAFARFLGASPGTTHGAPSKVQTYAHRTLLAWIGWQIAKNHPALGVGWEGSAEPASFAPYLPAARRRFPDEAPTAFPSASPNRQYGVQNSWIQAFADLGVLGLVLWAAMFLTAAVLAGREVLRTGSALALYALSAVCVLVWLWTAQGFVAGIPLDALTFLVLGLAATRLEVE